jgi:demethylmenaquinone methyltransferase / 2-methoxy-6-polyprenyl-1,4-benzoquinol methylase
MLATESKLPSLNGTEKRRYVRRMFTAIAPRYDFLNHLLSLNFDRRWRRQAVCDLGWESCPDGRFLDLCAGTLDLAATLAHQPGFRGRIVGADFVPAMLAQGRGKAKGVTPVAADALELPFRTGAFDGAMVGFGVRNLADLDAGLAEAARVLKPGARFVILEFTTPPRQPLRGLYLLYFKYLLPWIGRRVSRHDTAYSYLPASVLEFPDPRDLIRRMEAQGFTEVRYRPLLGGICGLHVGRRHGAR